MSPPRSITPTTGALPCRSQPHLSRTGKKAAADAEAGVADSPWEHPPTWRGRNSSTRSGGAKSGSETYLIAVFIVGVIFVVFGSFLVAESIRSRRPRVRVARHRLFTVCCRGTCRHLQGPLRCCTARDAAPP